MKDWAERQVSGSLTAIRKALDPVEFYEWLLQLANVESKLTEKHYNAIAEYQLEIDRRTKTQDEFYLMKDVKQFFNDRGMSFVF
jgi:hypothetical protein